MKVIYGIGKIKKKIPNAVVAIGVFDGVHRGHAQLIQQAVRRAGILKGQAVIMTFYPHPVHVLYPQKELPLINSLDHRLKLLADLGIDRCVVIHFTKSFARLSPAAFIRQCLIRKFNLKEVFVGDDFRFGQNREGTLEVFRKFAKEYNFRLNVVDPVRGGKEKISSTHIRNLIKEGDLPMIKKLLGRDFSLLGTVERGENRGASLGFPTANIYPKEGLLLPNGAYAVEAEVEGKKHGGMANIGMRPSFGNGERRINVEVHLFGFNALLYGKTISVKFLKKLRKEKKYSTPKQLIERLKKDRLKAMKLLSN